MSIVYLAYAIGGVLFIALLAIIAYQRLVVVPKLDEIEKNLIRANERAENIQTLMRHNPEGSKWMNGDSHEH